MSLLREIQDIAVDSKVDISTLLRKCKILSARLGSPEFKMWVDRELLGYTDHTTLPDYRILKVHSKGHFSGPFQSGLRNADIPISCLPAELQESYSHSYIVSPVASLENMIANSDGGSAHEPWNPTFVAFIGQEIYQGMNCMQAWKSIPINALNGILDIIRTKVLNFALEIESENPEAGEAPLNSNPLPPEKLHNIVNNYIYGGNNNLATNSSNVEQTNNISGNNDEIFMKLLDVVKDTEETLRMQLTTIIEDMKITQGSRNFKDHYIKFVEVISTHMQILGVSLAPLLPELTKFLH